MVSKSSFDSKSTDIEKINITGLVTTAALNSKLQRLKIEIPNITNMATKTALNTKVKEIENRIPHIIIFVNAPEFNRLVKINFDARMKEAAKDLATKGDMRNALNIGKQNRRITKRFDTYDSGCFIGKSYFGDDELQNYKAFQPDFKYFTTFSCADKILSCKAK